MSKNSAIEWTNHTFNPWWGCVRVSPGCQKCYAETLANRWDHDIWGVNKPRRFFGDKHWNEPLKWDREAAKAGEPAFVFCGSMCDWLEDRPDLVEPRKRLMDLVEKTPHLIWQMLTKRIENVYKLAINWTFGAPSNVWLGVSTEDQKTYDERIGHLKAFEPFYEKIWLSVEPQLGPIMLDDLARVDWVICGGESGPGHRPFDLEWARELKLQCDVMNIPFFMKQLGGHPDKRHDMSKFPPDLQVRQFPDKVPFGT